MIDWQLILEDSQILGFQILSKTWFVSLLLTKKGSVIMVTGDIGTVNTNYWLTAVRDASEIEGK